MLLQFSAASARKGNTIYEDTGSLDEQNNPFVEGPKWEERELKLPPYPKDGDLMDLELDDPNGNFTYYLDEKSLSVSKKDYVVRYTMVIESSRGTRNVFYEGIRCNTEEYKTYAFGAGKGKLRARKKPEWKPLNETGYTRFRAHMMQYYFCEWRLPRQRNTIINKIKYATPGGNLDG
ncbi:MAG: hypothetical protein GY814_17495 [Gammaproteobacteria bacterium]|nr:hypothetical protein [Gammaproteobacteria bacterium]